MDGKPVVGLQSGDKESAAAWREFFRDLNQRGFDVFLVKLGIMDGLSGLQKVLTEDFARAKGQRCQADVARNVLAKVPQAQKREVADDMRSIFYASSRPKVEGEFSCSTVVRLLHEKGYVLKVPRPSPDRLR